MRPPLRCRRCRSLLPAEAFRAEGLVPCASCGSGVQAVVFPARFRPPAPSRPGAPRTADQAACFFHADRRADVACDRCGRFVCRLCDLPFGSRHLCPSCVDPSSPGERPDLLRHRATRWDSLVLLVALGPVVLLPLVYFSLFTAPLALILAWYFGRRPQPGLVPRGKGLYLAGFLLALVQVLLWAAGLYWIVYQIITNV